MERAYEAALSVLEYVHAHPEGSGEEHETAGGCTHTHTQTGLAMSCTMSSRAS